MAEFLNTTQMTQAEGIQSTIEGEYDKIEGVLNGKTQEEMRHVCAAKWLSAKAHLLQALGDMTQAMVANEAVYGK